MVAQRAQKAGLVIALLGLVACGGGAGDGAGGSTDLAPVECPELDDQQLVQLMRLQNEGIQSYQEREPSKAVELLEKARQMNPCDPSIYNDLGIAYHLNHEVKKAIEVLSRGVDVDPLYPHTHLNLGIVYDDFANFEKAAEEYEKFIELSGQFGDVHGRLGMVYMKMNRFDDARAALEEAAKAKPNDWEIWYNLGNISFREEDYTSAEAHYRKCLEANENYTEAHYKLGMTLQRQGREEEAQASFDAFKDLSAYQEKIDELNRLLRQNADRADAVHMLLGFQYYEMGRLDDAIENYKKSIALKDTNPEAYVGLANSYRQQKKYDEALAAATRANELAPKMLQTYDALLNIHHDQGQFDEAIGVLGKMQKAQPDYHEALLNMGMLHREQHQYREAVSAFRQYIEKKPQNVLAHELLVSIYTEAQDERYRDGIRALEHAKRAQQLGSQRWDLLAWAYLMNGQVERGESMLKRALAEADGAEQEQDIKDQLAQVEEFRRKNGL